MRPQRRRRPPQAPVNKYVKAQTLTVIDDSGDKLGVFSKDDALKLAQEKGLDLELLEELKLPSKYTLFFAHLGLQKLDIGLLKVHLKKVGS